MFYFLSKFLPPLVYPAGLACVLLSLALLLGRRSKWQPRLVALALAALWLGGNRIVTMALVRSLEWQYLPNKSLQTPGPHAEVIVVLGGSTRAQAFPRLMTEVSEDGDRLLYAAQLYRQGAAPRILVSGGSPPWVGASSVSGAESMAEVLTILDVPREALWLEGTSRNTHENAVETQKILKREGITHVILVTSAMHMPRSNAIFAKTDLDVIPAPADYRVTQDGWEYYTQPDPLVQLYNLLPTAENLALTTQALKEYIGIWIYGLRGWL
jgi:uncharacterized SAM-binding protein YcdF (DUF218 family)